jgi:hypothetical protein
MKIINSFGSHVLGHWHLKDQSYIEDWGVNAGFPSGDLI